MNDLVFPDPRRWAQRAVATPLRYHLFQVQFFAMAIAILAAFFGACRAVAKTQQWWTLFGMTCIFVVIGVIWTPLLMLRALRACAPSGGQGGFDVMTVQAAGPAKPERSGREI